MPRLPPPPRPSPLARAPRLGVAAAALALLTGCPGGGDAGYPARTPTPGKATLPPTPTLDPALAPDQYDDGAWSVRGLLAAKGVGRGEEPVPVRGYVATLHTCPDLTRGCKPAPHLMITDRADLRGRRLLVGGAFDVDRDRLALGKQVTLSGRLVRGDPDGRYFAPGGLLLLAPPPPPPEADAAP